MKQFIFESDHKSYFSLKKCYSMIIVLTWIIPPPLFGYRYYCPYNMDLPSIWWKKLFPNDLSF